MAERMCGSGALVACRETGARPPAIEEIMASMRQQEVRESMPHVDLCGYTNELQPAALLSTTNM